MSSANWQSDFDRAWDSCDILRKGATDMAARSWYTKGRVAQSCVEGLDSTATSAILSLLRDLLPLVDPLQLSLNDDLRKRIEEAAK